MAYTLGSVLVRAVMENTTGLVADQVVNDFAFDAGAALPTTGQVDAMLGAVDDFYRVTQSVNAVGQFISESVNRSATHSLQAWHIIPTPMGPPFRTDDWLGPVTAFVDENLPNEVAGVLSFHADLTGIFEEVGSTRPRARRRGRLYIGPLCVEAISATVPNPPLSPAFTLCLREAAVALVEAAVGWSVWSREDQLLRPVEAGWTDNAPDTQRRRGQDSTIRAIWAV